MSKSRKKTVERVKQLGFDIHDEIEIKRKIEEFKFDFQRYFATYELLNEKIMKKLNFNNKKQLLMAINVQGEMLKKTCEMIKALNSKKEPEEDNIKIRELEKISFAKLQLAMFISTFIEILKVVLKDETLVQRVYEAMPPACKQIYENKEIYLDIEKNVEETKKELKIE